MTRQLAQQRMTLGVTLNCRFLHLALSLR